ncbi:hypothetical protein UVI_02038410 [Ustilaginoidea virens]|uniref:Protein PBN1 n=1 Tax=Ustilaginoidea virens TaxID=1159556 RepID=A0A1B5KT33_USTVR|nr:hypothetical protein UVI_02038410 [Ustilaginoidea virens]
MQNDFGRFKVQTHARTIPTSYRQRNDPSRLAVTKTRRSLARLSESPTTFTKRGDGRSFNLPDASLFQVLEDPSPLTTWAAGEFCREEDTECHGRLQSLSTGSSLDISWDSTLQTLRVNSLLPLRHQAIGASGSPHTRTEVGILSKDAPPNQQPHELGVSGLLVVLEDAAEPSGTLFSFPARHRLSNASFTAQFLQPTGLHPSLQLRVSSNVPPVADEHCAAFAYFTLPKTIFTDRHQLADHVFLASKNLTALRHTSQPVDLEAPAYTTKPWGSSVLLELAPPGSYDDPQAQEWTAQVPMHLRYLKPSRSGSVAVEIPYPAVFWACSSSAQADFSNNPFDRTRLGYDGLLDTNTVFWHVGPQPVAADRITASLSVPVLADKATSWVGPGTLATVSLGFAWLLWKLAAAYSISGYGHTPRRQSAQARKQK